MSSLILYSDALIAHSLSLGGGRRVGPGGDEQGSSLPCLEQGRQFGRSRQDRPLSAWYRCTNYRSGSIEPV